jgi:integrase
MRQLRGHWQLQRSVPTKLQGAAGRSLWTAPGGKTRHEAQRRLSAFLRATDQEIQRLSQVTTRELGVEELTDSLPTLYDLNDREVFEALETGADEAQDQGWMNPTQAELYRRVLRGQEKPGDHVTAAALIDMAAALKSPAEQTRREWQRHLSSFLEHVGLVYPSSVAKEHALAYRSHLLQVVSPATAKTRLAYLSGLFSVLAEHRGEETNPFMGVAKRIKTTRLVKEVVSVTKPSHPALLLLYFTGARLAEIAGLRAEDLKEDRIVIRPNTLRPLKTAASTREIPVHPSLVEVVMALRGKGSADGHLFPGLYNEQLQRWGMRLQDVCRRECGVSPKGLRDRAVTVLRSHGLNEAVAARLLGHTPSWMTAQYGGVPWAKLVEAVALL